MVFYCDRAAGFGSDTGSEDEGYFDAFSVVASTQFEFSLRVWPLRDSSRGSAWKVFAIPPVDISYMASPYDSFDLPTWPV